MCACMFISMYIVYKAIYHKWIKNVVKKFKYRWLARMRVAGSGKDCGSTCANVVLLLSSVGRLVRSVVVVLVVSCLFVTVGDFRSYK